MQMSSAKSWLPFLLLAAAVLLAGCAESGADLDVSPALTSPSSVPNATPRTTPSATYLQGSLAPATATSVPSPTVEPADTPPMATVPPETPAPETSEPTPTVIPTPTGGGNDHGFEAIRLSLQVPSPVQAGDTVPLKLTARNVTGTPVELGLAGLPESPCGDFIIATPDGKEVWRLFGQEPPEGTACPMLLWIKTLGPGDELIAEGEWQQTDNRHVPVAAGSYVVRALLDIRLDVNTPQERGLTLASEEQPLVILPQ
jgi:hypothetical protein